MRCDHYYVAEAVPGGGKVWICRICGHIRGGGTPDAVRDTAWQEHAACLHTDPELWFPEAGRVDIAAAAKAICDRCPVRAECLAYAMDEQITDGIWGGLAAKERLKLRRMERAA